jgi:two-component system, NarL family, nitrate/nitrite response regulator NarL
MTRADLRAPGKVLVVDDHPLVADRVATLIEHEGYDATIAGPDLSTASVLSLAARTSPASAVIDLWLGPYGEATGTIRSLVERHIAVHVLTEVDDAGLLARAVEAGARRVLTKDLPLPDLAAGLRAGLSGQGRWSPTARELAPERLHDHRRALTPERRRFERLTPRQAEVLSALIDGHSATTIARELGVSLATVRAHIRGLLMTLDVHSQLAAVALAHRVGWQRPVGRTYGRVDLPTGPIAANVP